MKESRSQLLDCRCLILHLETLQDLWTFQRKLESIKNQSFLDVNDQKEGAFIFTSDIVGELQQYNLVFFQSPLLPKQTIQYVLQNDCVDFFFNVVILFFREEISCYFQGTHSTRNKQIRCTSMNFKTYSKGSNNTNQLRELIPIVNLNTHRSFYMFCVCWMKGLVKSDERNSFLVVFSNYAETAKA